MKITITSHGSRGDVQPYLALAVGLKHAGHQVTLVTSYNYADWIESYGVQMRPTRFSMQEFTKQPEVQAILAGRNFVKKLSTFRQMMVQGPEAMNEVWASIEGADFVIQSPTSGGALEAAELRGIPVAMAYPVPFAPTRAYPSIFLGRARFSLGAHYNRLTHTLMHKMLWSSMSGPMTNAIRKKLGLPKARSFAEQAEVARKLGIPSLYGFSEHVLPKPADWDGLQHITGYWFLDAPDDWRPPVDLQQFLESGPPPIYLGFGSMNQGDSVAMTQVILKALELSGQRGVVLTGWGGLTPLDSSSHVLFVEDVPHDWLFQRVAAIVHHGGAGTTGAGLRAGVPNIIAPVGADQFFWAERVRQLGVGPRASGIKDLTAEILAQAIDIAINDSSMRARAAALGQNIRAEDGVTRAMEIIERQARDKKPHAVNMEAEV